ncbi:MAG TPA: hypothetical protein VLF20_01420 [Patescibacteria group bacterium]|nr:hypothetical protein [Patescibacteria group bacterium]
MRSPDTVRRFTDCITKACPTGKPTEVVIPGQHGFYSTGLLIPNRRLLYLRFHTPDTQVRNYALYSLSSSGVRREEQSGLRLLAPETDPLTIDLITNNLNLWKQRPIGGVHEVESIQPKEMRRIEAIFSRARSKKETTF